MLKQRVVTALVLVGVLLPALASKASWPFAVLSLMFVSAAGWEWSRLNQWLGWRAVAIGALVAIAGHFAALAVDLNVTPWVVNGADTSVGAQAAVGAGSLDGLVVPAQVWWVTGIVWLLGGIWALKFGAQQWKLLPNVLRVLMGMALLVMAWLALTESKTQGLNFLLSVFSLVWTADIGAYFGGRAFGRRKLAISISPGKSWEGVWSGMTAVVALSAAWIWVDRNFAMDSLSLYSHLLAGLGPVGLLCGLVFLTGMSVVGDLFESLIKRQAGAKDSSQLLPGHGGVLDRLDALLPVFPWVLALMSLCHG